MDDRHAEGLGGHVAVRPVQRAVDVVVVHARHRRPRRGQVLHAVGVGAAAQPVHGDGRAPAGFRDGVAGQTKVRQRIVVHDGQRRRVGVHAAVDQRQGRHPVRVVRVVVHDPEGQVGRALAVHKHEVGHRQRVVGSLHGCPAQVRQRVGQGAGQATQPVHGHRQGRAALGHRVAARRKRQRARPRVVPPVDPHQPVHHGAVVVRELPAEDQPVVVAFHQHGVHHVFGPGPKVDLRVQRTVGVEPRHVPAHLVVHQAKPAAHHHPPVALHRHGGDEGVHARAGVEGAVQRTGRRELRDVVAARAVDGLERAADHGLSARRQRDGVDGVVRAAQPVAITRVQRAVRVQPRHPSARRAADHLEVAADHDLPVALDRQRPHPRVRAGPGVEARVQGAIRVQPRHEVPHGGVHQVELAARHHFPVRLQGQGQDRVVRARERVVAGVHRAVGIQPRQVGPALPAVAGEVAAQDHFPVGLHRHGVDRTVGAHTGAEAQINRPVQIHPRHVPHRHAAQRAEAPAHHHLA